MTDEKVEWTNDDIDAAFCMGFINARASIADLQFEIKRLKSLGMKPWMAMANIRHGKSFIKEPETQNTKHKTIMASASLSRQH